MSVKFIDGDEAIITVWKRKIFPWRKVKVSFRGSCTVWHNAETGKRASTSTESFLSDLWTKAKWENKEN